MTTATAPLEYDPYDYDTFCDPYPTFARLREEAPVYRNEKLDFWLLSRHADVMAAHNDFARYSSTAGPTIEKMPPEQTGPLLIAKDPPEHRWHRKVIGKVFTPRRINALEPYIRERCRELLDPFVGEPEFDVAEQFALQFPLNVISELLNIPHEPSRRDPRARRPDPGPHRRSGARGKADAGTDPDLRDLPWAGGRPRDQSARRHHQRDHEHRGRRQRRGHAHPQARRRRGGHPVPGDRLCRPRDGGEGNSQRHHRLHLVSGPAPAARVRPLTLGRGRGRGAALRSRRRSCRDGCRPRTSPCTG